MKSIIRLRRLAPAAALIALPIFGNFYCGAYAQTAQSSADANRKEIVEERRVVVQRGGEGAGAGAHPITVDVHGGNDFVFARGEGGMVDFVSSEMSFDRRTVKGAPYTAEAVTETVQTLADGNRIVRRTSAQLARDGEGRTRREQKFNFVGDFATANDTPSSIFINDPVTGVNYVLETRSKTARKMPTMSFNYSSLRKRDGTQVLEQFAGKDGVASVGGEGERIIVIAEDKDGVKTTKTYKGKEAEEFLAKRKDKIKLNPISKLRDNTKQESLGKQTIEGVEAEGTRTTTTIPAGQIGNEQPILITSERWYSPELQTVVMTRRSDPRTGETTYKLTNINRSEPARTLFEVPGDYTIKEAPARTRVERMRNEN